MKYYKYLKYVNLLIIVAAIIISIYPSEGQVYSWLYKYDNFLMSYSWMWTLG